jgi:queuine tRNA-ribosyltransferase
MTTLFRLVKKEGRVRLGELTTAHGSVLTPVFMPVATHGTIKTLTPDEVKEIGFGMVLSNTYHLYLRPGVKLIEKMGGLHKFMAWDNGILTDSGGYQVFSLATLRDVNDDGVTFRSHIDGSEHFINPESAVRFQEQLGSDIAMVLDECPPSDAPEEKVAEAVARTNLWAERSKEAHVRHGQHLFAIVQGGVFAELRQQSAEYLTKLDFPGYAIGGLSLGEPKTVMNNMVGSTTIWLPEERPRYLMGVGSPEDILEGVALGIDMFDSALPTRVARNGALFTPEGRVDIGNAVYREMEWPVDTECDCYSCRTFSAAYLNHLFNSRELLFYRLATLHNLTFIARLMEKIRGAIAEGKFTVFKDDFLRRYQPTNEATRLEQKIKWRKATDISR